MLWPVDIDRLHAEGLIAEPVAAEMKRRAREDAVALGVNTLLVAGIVTVIAGATLWVSGPRELAALGALVLAIGTAALAGLGERFRVPANAAALVGLAMALGGALWTMAETAESLAPAIWLGGIVAAAGLGWRALGGARFAFVSGAVATLGLATHLAGVLAADAEFGPGPLAILHAGLATLTLGVALDLRVLSALSIPLLASVFSSAGYSHAMYSLAITEPTLTILGFALVAGACLVVTAAGAAERWARHARIAGLLAFVWINMAFWIGSLWGDLVGLHAWGPAGAAVVMDWEAYEAARVAYEAQAMRIPPGAFALVWAVLIVATGAWAALTARRSVLNAAATFGAIHFYTQWFERLEQTPGALVAAGVIAIAAAWGMLQVNGWLRARAAG